jgi:hypothetical protein
MTTIALSQPRRGRLARYGSLLAALAKSRSIDDVSLKVLPILSKLGLAWLSALLVQRTIRSFTARCGHRVLIIEKAIFNDDVLEALAAIPELEVLGVKRAIIKAMAVGILPRHICDDAAYISDDPAAQQAKRRYRDFCRRMARHLIALGRYDAVITGNWAYWAERELGAALEEMGTPFVVLHKEGIKPPARSEFLRDLFRRTRGQFMGRRMLVYQAAEREHQVSGGIARDDQIKIVGMPRMDRLHTWRRRAAAGEVKACAARPLVLFLAFLPNNFLPSYSGVESDLAWDGLCRGSLDVLFQLARVNPQIDVIIRPRGSEVKATAELAAACGPVPANLKISADGNVVPLLQAAWVVSGHNTTVLLEGLAVGKPVVVPHFAEALDLRYAGYLVDVGEAAEHPRSEGAYAERLKAYCVKPPRIETELSPSAIAALDHWTGNSDGRSAERVRQAILKEIGLNASSVRDVTPSTSKARG